jgi:hypothetical protein
MPFFFLYVLSSFVIFLPPPPHLPHNHISHYFSLLALLRYTRNVPLISGHIRSIRVSLLLQSIRRVTDFRMRRIPGYSKCDFRVICSD